MEDYTEDNERWWPLPQLLTTNKRNTPWIDHANHFDIKVMADIPHRAEEFLGQMIRNDDGGRSTRFDCSFISLPAAVTPFYLRTLFVAPRDRRITASAHQLLPNRHF